MAKTLSLIRSLMTERKTGSFAQHRDVGGQKAGGNLSVARPVPRMPRAIRWNCCSQDQYLECSCFVCEYLIRFAIDSSGGRAEFRCGQCLQCGLRLPAPVAGHLSADLQRTHPAPDGAARGGVRSPAGGDAREAPLSDRDAARRSEARGSAHEATEGEERIRATDHAGKGTDHVGERLLDCLILVVCEGWLIRALAESRGSYSVTFKGP